MKQLALRPLLLSLLLWLPLWILLGNIVVALVVALLLGFFVSMCRSLYLMQKNEKAPPSGPDDA